MKNDALVKTWLDFAEMDSNLADFTFQNMYPKPLELICYHCQQAAEKAIKALIIFVVEDTDVPKTHDLEILLDMVADKFEVVDALYDACSDLTPYGVRVRYPREIYVDELMTAKAISDKNLILNWIKTLIV